MAVTALSNPGEIGVRTAETVAALFYVSNWTTIGLGVSYFARFNGPGPLDHLWSLAVEEQFYVFWPLIVWGLVTLLRRRWDRVALVTLGLAVLSFIAMWVIAAPGFDNTRAYEGTDTRAGGLLIGAALGMMWRPARASVRLPVRGRVVLETVGVLSLVAIGLLLTQTDEYSMFLYRGGILILSVATALLIAVTTHPASLLGKAVGAAPLRWMGERSYGIYPLAPAGDRVPARGGAQGLPVAAGAAVHGDRRPRLAQLGAGRGPDPPPRAARRAAPRSRAPRPGRPEPLRESSPGTPLLGNVLALVLVATAGLTAITVMGPSVSSSAAQSPTDLNNPPLPPPSRRRRRPSRTRRPTATTGAPMPSATTTALTRSTRRTSRRPVPTSSTSATRPRSG